MVIAATIAPVPSYWHSFSVIAARITASCHSKGIDRERDHAVQKSIVRSKASRVKASTDVVSVSSGPRTRDTSRSTVNGSSCSMNGILMSVVKRRVVSRSTQRRWLLPLVCSGTWAPQSRSGRTRTRTRGAPRSGLIRRTNMTGW